MIYEKAMQLADALESREYGQIKGMLKSNAGYCCLGVACELSHVGEFMNSRYLCPGDSSWSSLPEGVMAYYGFYHREGIRRDGDDIVIGGKKYDSLINANDNGCTFTQIGQYIRENWKAL